MQLPAASLPSNVQASWHRFLTLQKGKALTQEICLVAAYCMLHHGEIPATLLTPGQEGRSSLRQQVSEEGEEARWHAHVHVHLTFP